MTRSCQGDGSFDTFFKPLESKSSGFYYLLTGVIRSEKVSVSQPLYIQTFVWGVVIRQAYHGPTRSNNGPILKNVDP